MRIIAVYRLSAAPGDIDGKALSLAIEQSVEMPLEAIEDARVREEIVGRVEVVEPIEPGLYRVRVSLAAATLGEEPGQLMNMLFGNSSLHDFAVLEDVELPPAMTGMFGGPRWGIEGLRQRVGAGRRALTCAALKPQGRVSMRESAEG